MDDLGGMLLTISTSSREIHYGSTTMPVLMIPMAITTTKTRANGLTYPQAKREALGSLDSKGIQSVSFMQASHLILRKSCFVCIICVFTRTYRAVCQTQNNEAGVSSMEENVKEKKSKEKPSLRAAACCVQQEWLGCPLLRSKESEKVLRLERSSEIGLHCGGARLCLVSQVSWGMMATSKTATLESFLLLLVANLSRHNRGVQSGKLGESCYK
mmetsp:Transcript_72465/g.158124  ORF Transcript_72465/g.158124 Transcript_72465/m.158124 type:complete len:214 (+) Transcript_72465:258-899(+)